MQRFLRIQGARGPPRKILNQFKPRSKNGTTNRFADSSYQFLDPEHSERRPAPEYLNIRHRVTDARPGLQALFEPDKEIVTYRSKEECADKVAWLLDHPRERAAIAAAGQRRTLRDHTFAGRVDEMLGQLKACL